MGSLFCKALDFALTKAGKDSNFKLKTEQKSIIEAIVYFFTLFARAVNFLKNFRQNFLVWLLHNLELLRFLQFVSAFQQGSPLPWAFRNYLLRRRAPGSEKRSNRKLLNPCYTISSVVARFMSDSWYPAWFSQAYVQSPVFQEYHPSNRKKRLTLGK